MEPNKNNNEPNLLEVKVHPHLVGAVQTNTDLDGKKRIIPSTLVNMYHTPCKPQDATHMTVEKAFEVIAERVAAVGMFSSRFVNTDEFTRVYYENTEEDDDNHLFCYQIECAETLDLYYPHDRVCCHKDNEWMFKCFQIMFWHQKELLPHKYLNLPHIINIKRSSGEVQKGITNPNDAIRVRIGSKDTEPRVYIKVHFSCKNPQSTESIECGYNKLIYMEDFLEVNPDFKTLKITFPKDKIEEIDMDGDIKKPVVEKVIGNYQSWFSTVLIPSLEKIESLNLQIIQT